MTTMPSQRPRVALTMPDDLNAIFDRLSELQGIPKTKLIVELLDAYKPILNETIKALEKIEADKSNAVQIAKEFGQNVLLMPPPHWVLFLKRFGIYDRLDNCRFTPATMTPSKLISGVVMSFDANGANEWIVNKMVSVEGSHSSIIQIKSIDNHNIWVSGNPSKFLQGHNIFGTDDLSYLMGRFFDELLKHEELGLRPTSMEYEKIQAGDYFATRIDFNLSWHLKDKDAVLSWLRSAAQCANLRHRGAGQFTGDTLYFGKHSRFWALKCYSKGHEITAKTSLACCFTNT